MLESVRDRMSDREIKRKREREKERNGVF